MQKQLAACGVKPQVVRDIADLQPLLERDGAAVIDGPECGAEATRALARQIFAEKTLAIPDAARVFERVENLITPEIRPVCILQPQPTPTDLPTVIYTQTTCC